jgi:hypothetical protein
VLATVPESGPVATDTRRAKEEPGPQQSRSRTARSLLEVESATDAEWEAVAALYDNLLKKVRQVRRKGLELGLPANEDQLLTWALDYAFFEVRKALRQSSDLQTVLTRVRYRLYLYLGPQLLRRLKTEQGQWSQETDLDTQPHSRCSEPVETVVQPLNLPPQQEQLLLRVMYKREGEKLNQVLTSEQDRWNWKYLRQQLAVRLREGNSE